MKLRLIALLNFFLIFSSYASQELQEILGLYIFSVCCDKMLDTAYKSQQPVLPSKVSCLSSKFEDEQKGQEEKIIQAQGQIGDLEAQVLHLQKQLQAKTKGESGDEQKRQVEKTRQDQERIRDLGSQVLALETQNQEAQAESASRINSLNIQVEKYQKLIEDSKIKAEKKKAQDQEVLEREAESREADIELNRVRALALEEDAQRARFNEIRATWLFNMQRTALEPLSFIWKNSGKIAIGLWVAGALVHCYSVVKQENLEKQVNSEKQISKEVEKLNKEKEVEKLNKKVEQQKTYLNTVLKKFCTLPNRGATFLFGAGSVFATAWAAKTMGYGQIADVNKQKSEITDAQSQDVQSLDAQRQRD